MRKSGKPPRRIKFTERLVYWLYRGFGAIFLVLPLPWTFRIGQAIGLVGWAILPGYRGLARRNLERAFPEWASNRIAERVRKHFQTLGANFLCAFVLMEKPWEEARKYFDVSAYQKMNTEIEATSSIVVLLPHIGNWELMLTAPNWVLRSEMATVFQPLRNRLIDEHIRKSRALYGVELLDRSEGFNRGIAILKQGGFVTVLSDQHAGDKGVWVPFFGRLCSTTPLPAIMARKAHSRMCWAMVRTVGVARWRLETRLEEFSPGASTEEITAQLNDHLEEKIRENPQDWFWVHDRWKIPSPRFLLREYKRGVFLPDDPGKLKRFRILIRSGNWLGDAVMSTEAVRRIKRGRPDAEVTILANRNLVEFWETIPEVDAVIPIERKEGVLAVAKKIRDRFDVAILFPNSPRSGIEVWLAKIPRRVGYRRPWRNFFLNQFIPEQAPPQPVRHQSRIYLRIAERIGADISEPLPPAAAWVPEPLTLGLCPGAEYGPAKRWPHFGEAARILSEQHGIRWLIFGTAKERELGDQIASEIGANAVNLAGQTTLSQLIRELGRCRALLTNDTGTMHLAAHLGVPTIALFGSTEPALTGPIGAGHTVIRHHVECSPCFLRQCPIDFRCMNRIAVAEVVDGVERVLARQPMLMAR
ncbi:MAG: lipopolysaccharide heptosyltransferase II [Chthoniobacterales bacterium]